jgi:hypothetical protein
MALEHRPHPGGRPQNRVALRHRSDYASRATLSGLLAYVFVHRPADSTDPIEYLSRLRAFHDVLATNRPLGFVRSWVWRVDAGPLGEALEDWYVVEGWAGLGVLNEAAVTGPRSAGHDQVASLAGEGAGAVYRLIHGTPTPTHAHRFRLTKRPGVPYAEFEHELSRDPATETIWKRQMVLGPDAEFLIDSSKASLSAAVDAVAASPLSLLYP